MRSPKAFRTGLLHVFLLSGALAFAADDPSPLVTAFSPDGRVLAVGDEGSRAVVLVDAMAKEQVVRIGLKGSPVGLVWTASNRLFASESGACSIAEIDIGSREVIRRIQTGRYVHGLAAASKKGLLLAADYGLDSLWVLDLHTGDRKTLIPVGRQPTVVSVTPDESLAVVSNLIPATAATDPRHASEVTIIDLNRLTVRCSVRLPTGATNTRGVAISGDGGKAYVVHTLGRFHLPTTQLDRGWVNTNALSVIDLAKGECEATVLLDQPMDGAADPWGIAVDPRRRKLLITLAGVHQLALIDLAGLETILSGDRVHLANDLSALHRSGIMRRIDLPARGPRGISISPDGSKVAVGGYFSGNLVLLDPEARSFTSVVIGKRWEPDLIRRGELAYHDADSCFQRWLSCSSCHPYARADGLNWDLLNDGIGNPKNARTMVLSDRTPPVMSLGVRDRMETAVKAGYVHIQFTEPDPERIASVIAYLKSLEPEVSPYRLADGSLNESALRGREVFHRPAVGCAYCHGEPLFTDLAMRDVGTSGPLDQGARSFDTPTLREVWRTPPYLHDGRAATLREVLLDENLNDEHGRTSSLSSVEIEDLVAYLLSL